MCVKYKEKEGKVVKKNFANCCVIRHDEFWSTGNECKS